MSSARVLIVDDDIALLQALPEALRLRLDTVTVDTCDASGTLHVDQAWATAVGYTP